MILFGTAIERGIRLFAKAKVRVETRGGVQPLLALESQLSSERTVKLLEVGEEKILTHTIPALSEKYVLEISEGPARFLPRFLQLGAKRVVGLQYQQRESLKQGDVSRGFFIRGLASMLPFSSERFDYVAARFATSSQGDVQKHLKEIERVLRPGGQGVLIDFHPYGPYASRGEKRLRDLASPITGLTDYYRLCKHVGLRVVDLRESFLDESMRQFFAQEEIHTYRSLKGSPLLVFLFLYKPRKGASKE